MSFYDSQPPTNKPTTKHKILNLHKTEIEYVNKQTNMIYALLKYTEDEPKCFKMC